MADYTIVSPAELDEIISHYAIGEPHQLESIPGGLGNSNFKLTTTDGVFLLKICNEKSHAELLVQIALLKHLRRYDYPTPAPIAKTNGELVHIIALHASELDSSCRVILYPFLPGGPAKLSPQTLAQIGEALAKLHRIPPPKISIPGCQGSSLTDELEQYATRSGLPRFPMGISQMLPFLRDVEGTRFASHRFVKWLTFELKRLEPQLSRVLPTGLLHGDIFADNTLFHDDKLIAILDFEEVAHDTFLIDVGVSVIGCCYTEQHQLNVDCVRSFLAAYNAVRPLTPREWECLDAYVAYAALSIAFWRFRQFNIRRPDKRRATAYQDMITRNANWVRDVYQPFLSAQPG